MASKHAPTLKIALVGSDWVKKNKVCNSLLDKDVFETEATTAPTKNHNIAFTRFVQDSVITVAVTGELFTEDLSDQDIKEKVKECVALCAPGPHALVLVVNSQDFAKRQRMVDIVNSFSEQAFQNSIVFFTDKDPKTDKEEIKSITELCGGRTYQFKKKTRRGALKAIKEIISGNNWSFVTCDKCKEKESTETPEPSTECSKQQDQDGEPTKIIPSSSCNVDSGLNLVLCGSNAAAKASAAALILGDQTESSPVWGKGGAEVCGRHVTLVQLPSLANTQFCKEDVLAVQQCVRLCDSGVGAFLLLVPRGPLSDEDKEEFRRVNHFFGEKVRGYCQIVVTGEGVEDTEGIRDIVEAGEGITEIPKVRYHILDKNSKVQQLLEKVEKIRKENDPGCYTTDMYITAQLRIHQNYHIQLDEISSLRGCNQEITGDIRIVLLGKTGQGKSATGNTILGGSKFEDRLAPNSVTTACQKATAMVSGRQIVVVDTPGLFDTESDNEDTKKEIRKCIVMAAPGPHVFLLVIALGRFTQEERDAVKIIQEMFGEEADKYTLVLFTRGDDLQGQPLDEYFKNYSNIKALLRKCGNRYLAFNNRDKSSNDQVPKLLDMINTMLRVNGGKCYTSEMFQKAEEALKQRQDRILKEREEEIKKEKEELQAKHEAAMNELKKEIEEERKRKEKERRRREEEIKCKEQAMKEAMTNLEEEEKRKRCVMEKEYKAHMRKNEEWIKQRTEEIQLEKQRQQEQWEKKIQEEQRKREEEEKKRKIRERKQEKEWQDKQRKENEKFDNERDTMMKKAEEEKQKKQQEYENRVKKEEEKHRDLEKKIKCAEQGRVKDLEEQKRKHEEECKRKMRRTGRQKSSEETLKMN
ncbi:GTPase IMAP family member 8-like [Alosa pseudoharengus]|uniref:GTPase IMAP family member 8-like n=1 Tax=Alosa pseudoharengus TaxID=34774 RepID=UPI003F896AC1